MDEIFHVDVDNHLLTSIDNFPVLLYSTVLLRMEDMDYFISTSFISTYRDLCIAYADTVTHCLQFDYDLALDRPKETDQKNLRMHIELTGHLAAFEDHFKTFESTTVELHDVSSSRGMFPTDCFVQVLRESQSPS